MNRGNVRGGNEIVRTLDFDARVIVSRERLMRDEDGGGKNDATATGVATAGRTSPSVNLRHVSVNWRHMDGFVGRVAESVRACVRNGDDGS